MHTCMLRGQSNKYIKRPKNLLLCLFLSFFCSFYIFLKIFCHPLFLKIFCDPMYSIWLGLGLGKVGCWQGSVQVYDAVSSVPCHVNFPIGSLQCSRKRFFFDDGRGVCLFSLIQCHFSLSQVLHTPLSMMAVWQSSQCENSDLKQKHLEDTAPKAQNMNGLPSFDIFLAFWCGTAKLVWFRTYIHGLLFAALGAELPMLKCLQRKTCSVKAIASRLE